MAERKKYQHLRWEDRLKLEGALRTGAKPDEIAAMLGCCRATVYNEIKRGQCIQQHDAEFVTEYCADFAERKYQENLRAKGPDLKIGHDHALAEFIESKIILEHYSPGSTLAFIKEQGLQFDTEICENTLYNYIYRGDVFLNLTPEHLLYKGKRHAPTEKRDQDRARLAKGQTIEDRPKEIWNRQTFGHWEMDSVMGTQDSHAALVVLTERLTRYGLIFRVPDHTAGSVVKVLDKLERKLGKNFCQIFRTITVDNGSEFQDCTGMERSLRRRTPRTTIYYCHPYSPGERGSNENMNRIVRRWFPKGTNFDSVTAKEVAQAEEWMNNYPRAILGWRSAGAVFSEQLSA